MSQSAEDRESTYDITKDADYKGGEAELKDKNKDIVFRAGHSRRVWNELYKVIDSSDVVIQVF
jgi:nuclear GTP-binding protein